jgi:AraC-like DNA-binding protein
MEVIHTLSDAMHFAAAITCLITGSLALHYSRLHQTSAVLLGISFLVIAYIHFAQYFVASGLVSLPGLYPTLDVAALLYMPFVYLCLRVTVTGQKINRGIWVHFIAPTFFILNFLPLLILPDPEKLPVLSGQIVRMSPELSKGWLLPGALHTPIRALLIFGYWIMELSLVAKRISPLRELNNPGKGWQRWILIFLAVQLIFVLPAIALLPGPGEAYQFGLIHIFGATGTLCLVVAVLMYPKLAFGIDVITQEGYGVVKTKNRLDDEQIVQTSQRLEHFLQDERPFLKQGYTIKELAESMDMPLHIFSAFINQALGKNFNDLMNHYRILYCQELVRNGEAKKLNLHGLALKCGFSNRNTFTIAFKKSTGLTPSKYLELMYGYRQNLKPASRKKARNRKRKSK